MRATPPLVVCRPHCLSLGPLLLVAHRNAAAAAVAAATAKPSARADRSAGNIANRRLTAASPSAQLRVYRHHDFFLFLTQTTAAVLFLAALARYRVSNSFFVLFVRRETWRGSAWLADKSMEKTQLADVCFSSASRCTAQAIHMKITRLAIIKIDN